MTRGIATTILCLLSLGCSTIEERRAQQGLEPVTIEETAELSGEAKLDRSRLRTATQEEIDRLGLKRGEYALRVNRTLIYPCQYHRAEDLAATLQPLIETQFGAGAFIIAHAETNHLFIYIPPFHERQNATRRATPPGSSSRARPLTPSR